MNVIPALFKRIARRRASAGAPSNIFYPTHDARVMSHQASTNYGSITDLDITSYGSAIREFFLVFEGCPDTAAATLHLYFKGSGGGDSDNDIIVNAASGIQMDESTLTWANKPSIPTQKGSVNFDVAGASSGDLVTVPLTGLAFDGSGNITLRVLASYNSGSLDYVRFHSKEQANAALHPRLVF